MINSTNHINKLIFHYQTKKILDKFKKNEKIAVLGVSFKPGSDDISGSKSVEIIKYLLKKGYKKIYTFDPSVKKDYLKTISKKIIHSNKLSNDHSQNYILCTSWPKYVKFLRENKKLNFIDFRYQV